MSTEKLSELSKPVAWTDERGSLCTNRNKERGLESLYHQDYEKYTTPLYSQECVSALDKVAQFWIGESAGWKKRAEDAEKRIAELEAQVKVWESAATKHLERAEEAEKRLATPVRLPEREFDDGSDKQVCILAGRFNSAIDKSAEAIRAAGFIVEGDE